MAPRDRSRSRSVPWVHVEDVPDPDPEQDELANLGIIELDPYGRPCGPRHEAEQRRARRQEEREERERLARFLAQPRVPTLAEIQLMAKSDPNPAPQKITPELLPHWALAVQLHWAQGRVLDRSRKCTEDARSDLTLLSEGVQTAIRKGDPFYIGATTRPPQDRFYLEPERGSGMGHFDRFQRMEVYLSGTAGEIAEREVMAIRRHYDEALCQNRTTAASGYSRCREIGYLYLCIGKGPRWTPVLARANLYAPSSMATTPSNFANSHLQWFADSTNQNNIRNSESES